MSKREEQQKQTENREWQNLSHQGRVEGEHVLEGDEPWGAGEQLLSSTQISSLCRIQQLVALELHCRERERREETTCNRHHFRCSCRLFNVPIISIHKYIARDWSLETKLYTLCTVLYILAHCRDVLCSCQRWRGRERSWSGSWGWWGPLRGSIENCTPPSYTNTTGVHLRHKHDLSVT